MKIEIETADELAIVSRGQVAKLDVTKLPADVIAQAVLHGLKQKIADAAASAKKFAEENDMNVDEAAQVMMDKAIANLVTNGWTAARTSSADPLATFKRQILRAVLAQPANAEHKAKYDACETAADKNAFLDKLGEGNEALEAKAKEAQEVKRKQDAEKAKLAQDIAI